MSNLILLRHGETAGQSSIRFYGSTDIALSEFGINQMRRAGCLLHKYSFKTVIASPLRRSLDSVSIVLNGREPEIIVIEDFREIDFGAWEGLTKEEIAERDPAAYRAWQESSPDARFPGGDSRAEFFNRVKKSALDVFNRAESSVLAVLHKGVIRGILSALLDTQVDELTKQPIELGSIHRLCKSSEEWELIDANETGHLGEYRKKDS